MPPVTKPKKNKQQQPKQEVIEQRAVLWPDIRVGNVLIPEKALRLTVGKAKELLGWENSAEYYNRRREADPTVSKEVVDKAFGSNAILTDVEGADICCWNNSHNRPYTDSWARSIAQDILKRKWRLNLENIIISKTGLIISGQHRLIGLILAAQMWTKDGMKWSRWWDEEPFIHALIATGCSEDQDVIDTIDNVRTRQLDDVFYTRPDLFGNNVDKVYRKKASKVLAKAVEFLWDRTQGAREKSDNQFRTHSSSVEFLDLHAKLLEYIPYLMELNKNNSLGEKGFGNIGVCVASLFLMASSDSNPDEYKNSLPPSQKSLNFDMEKKAKRFWEELAKDTSLFADVRNGLVSMNTEEEDARLVEKLCLLANAWAKFKDDEPLDMEEITPEYDITDKGRVLRRPWPTFGGIDYGQSGKGELTDAERKRLEAAGDEEGEHRDKQEEAAITEEKVRKHRERMRRTGPYAAEQGDPNDLS